MTCEERDLKFSNEIKELMVGKDEDVASATLVARSIRIGSYRSLRKDKIYFVESGIQIFVASFQVPHQIETIRLFKSDIIQVQAHFGLFMPLLAIFVTPNACKRITSLLKMDKSTGIWLDVRSDDDSMKRILILPEKITEDNKFLISRMFRDTMEEIEEAVANDILVKFSYSDVKKKSFQNSVEAINQKYCQYPAGGTSAISITTEDYYCLQDESFLNDVIIDFFLKWLHLGQLSEKNRDRTHIFSTYFYKRLTTRPQMQKNKMHLVEDDASLSPAQKRYARVKRWTKSVNIFEKDFVVIPINENSHWFVAVVCFPGLVGCRNIETDQPCPIPERQNKADMAAAKKSRRKKSGQISIDESIARTVDTSNKDEAEGSDSEMIDEEDLLKSIPDTSPNVQDDLKNSEQVDASNNEKSPEAFRDKTKKTKKTEDNVRIKQPCILIFDSLRTGSHAKLAATLREYLQCEYREKFGTERVFTKETIRGCCPKVPQQPNFSDCGIFLLQYIESFFENPILDYCLPITSLKKWFSAEVVRKKRSEIASLIRKLAIEQNPTKKFGFPDLCFVPEFGSGYSDIEDGETESSFVEVVDDFKTSYAKSQNSRTVAPTRTSSSPANFTATVSAVSHNNGITIRNGNEAGLVKTEVIVLMPRLKKQMKPVQLHTVPQQSISETGLPIKSPTVSSSKNREKSFVLVPLTGLKTIREKPQVKSDDGEIEIVESGDSDCQFVKRLGDEMSIGESFKCVTEFKRVKFQVQPTSNS